MSILDDEHIASTMRLIGETGDPRANAVQQIVDKASRRHTIGRAVKFTGVAALGLIVAAFVGAVKLSPPLESVSASTTSTPVAWQGLTGKALGDTLGLKGGPTETVACDDWFVEYADYEGFCLDPAVLEAAGITTRFDRDLVLWQITGLERSPKLMELVRLWEEYQDMQTAGAGGLGQESELWGKIAALQQDMRANE